MTTNSLTKDSLLDRIHLNSVYHKGGGFFIAKLRSKFRSERTTIPFINIFVNGITNLIFVACIFVHVTMLPIRRQEIKCLLKCSEHKQNERVLAISDFNFTG